MNRYEITITVDAQEFKVWRLAASESQARQQVHIAVERDSINKRMLTEYNPRLRPTKKPVTA